MSQLVNLRDEHAQIPLNPYDLFKSFFSSHHPAYLTSLARRSLGEGGL